MCISLIAKHLQKDSSTSNVTSMYKKRHTEAAGRKLYLKEILLVRRITTIPYFLAKWQLSWVLGPMQGSCPEAIMQGIVYQITSNAVSFMRNVNRLMKFQKNCYNQFMHFAGFSSILSELVVFCSWYILK